jgi:uncharacterized protein (DUF2236 family)
MLPPTLREKLGLPLPPARQRAFHALSLGARTSGPFLFGPLRNFGPHYVRWRRRALERGDVAAGVATSNAEKVAAA